MVGGGVSEGVFWSFLSLLAPSPNKEIENEPILVVCHKVIWQYEHQQIFFLRVESMAFSSLQPSRCVSKEMAHPRELEDSKEGALCLNMAQ